MQLNKEDFLITLYRARDFIDSLNNRCFLTLDDAIEFDVTTRELEFRYHPKAKYDGVLWLGNHRKDIYTGALLIDTIKPPTEETFQSNSHLFIPKFKLYIQPPINKLVVEVKYEEKKGKAQSRIFKPKFQ